MSTVTDRRGRALRDLRISVTDRCNMRCTYCMPREVFGADFRFMERGELLTFEEIARVARAAAAEGAVKIRLTGGEPLLRRELHRLVGMLAEIPGIEDLALTTNGLLLAGQAERLAGAGLRRATVSLDALDEGVFRSMSDARAPVGRVLEGIEAAQGAGLGPVKVNMVVRRGVNDHCVLEMAEHFRGRPEILRLIEYMDVGDSNGWRPQEVVPASELLGAISARWPLERLEPSGPGEVASRYRYRDGGGEIGTIHSVSEPFCQGCTRGRLSAEGRLYTCLFASRGEDLRGLLRGGADEGVLRGRLREVWTERSDRYSELRARGARGKEGTPTGRERELPKGTRAGRLGGVGRIEMSYIGG